jgi:hypothetical protein
LSEARFSTNSHIINEKLGTLGDLSPARAQLALQSIAILDLLRQNQHPSVFAIFPRYLAQVVFCIP